MVDDLCEWVFTEENSGYTVFAHNGLGYDVQFVLQNLYKNNVLPKAVFSGSKCIYLEVQNPSIRFLDSFAFIPMGLAKFPDCLELDSGQKGMFPHRFNLAQNWDFEGDYPPREFYDPEGMKRVSHDKFNEWYDEIAASGKRFNFKKELFKYCDQDVRILREGVLKFRKLMMETTHIEPFENTYTIAGLCMRVYRTLFLKEGQIGIIPPHGYRTKEKQSYIALQWIKFMEYDKGIEILHAGNGREVYIGNVGKVDGYREEIELDQNGEERKRKIVFEMHGCFFHGHDLDFEPNVLNPVSGKTMGELFEETKRKSDQLRSMGYEVIEKWECQWKSEIESSKYIQEFVDLMKKDSPPLQDPINPRDAFHGGRTNATKLYHEIDDSEEIRYYDICSLYPSINKYSEYPLFHPTVITSNFSSDPTSEYYGIIKCKIVPPRGLYHPVLPYRDKDGRLLFPLCRTCVEMKNEIPKSCNHESENERALEGTWCTPELKKAVELGYKISKIYEVWHYPHRGILFDEYVNMFLKIKVESSGWPEGCESVESKKRYIDEYKQREGIQLDENKISKNSGLRSIGKLCVNSFWGKLGQRTNLTSHTYITDPNEFFSLWADQTKDVVDVTIISDEMVRVGWKKNEELELPHPSVNVVLASFTTCNARLKLYSYLEQLGERVLYFDTHSIIFTVEKDEYCPPTGNFLGELTDECPDLGGEYITKFASGGAKNYAFHLNTGVTHVKVKGITLDVRNETVVNFDTLSEMLFSPNPSSCEKQVDFPSIIRRDGRTANVYTAAMKKKWRIVYTKRAIDWNTFQTYPFGY